MKAAEIKTRALLEQINSGSTMHKYNYSVSDASTWNIVLCSSESARRLHKLPFLQKQKSQVTNILQCVGNSKRSRRFFWVQKDELRWGRAKTDTDSQNVNLKECLGIVYGNLVHEAMHELQGFLNSLGWIPSNGFDWFVDFFFLL